MENKIVEVFCDQLVKEWNNRTEGKAARYAAAFTSANIARTAHILYSKHGSPSGDIGKIIKHPLMRYPLMIAAGIFGKAAVALYSRTLSQFKDCNKKHSQMINSESNANCRLEHSKKMLSIVTSMKSQCSKSDDPKSCEDKVDKQVKQWTKYVDKYTKMKAKYYPYSR
jgi:hypothetical protein